ncbi:MAG: hypothetical protein FWE78_02995 [Methanimicrococcus sp.]|nr:hypothetical protein [Methanimicrococcus sp.]
MNFDMISAGLKKSWDVFLANIVAYVVGVLILMIVGMLSIFLIPIILLAPLAYGFAYMAIKGMRGDKVEIGDMFIALKSVSAFIRSWMYLIIPFVIFFILGICVFLISAVLAQISGTLAFLFSMFMFLVYLVLLIVMIPIVFYSLYIYIMTPSENVVYAYKEGFAVFKANIVMTIIAIIVVYIMAIIPILGAIMGGLFTVYLLKELKPDLRDNS